MKIRTYESADLVELIELFRRAIMQGAAHDYTQEQLIAWASSTNNSQGWANRLDKQRVSICESGNCIAGFSSMEADGHLDLMFVHPEYQRRGVATRLYEELEEWAKGREIGRVFTEASLTALPFFQKMGFSVLARQSVERDGVTLDNFRMAKYL